MFSSIWKINKLLFNKNYIISYEILGIFKVCSRKPYHFYLLIWLLLFTYFYCLWCQLIYYMLFPTVLSLVSIMYLFTIDILKYIFLFFLNLCLNFLILLHFDYLVNLLVIYKVYTFNCNVLIIDSTLNNTNMFGKPQSPYISYVEPSFLNL